MRFLHDELLTCFDQEDVDYMKELNNVDNLIQYHDDGIMHIETIEKLEAIVAASGANLLLNEELLDEDDIIAPF